MEATNCYELPVVILGLRRAHCTPDHAVYNKQGLLFRQSNGAPQPPQPPRRVTLEVQHAFTLFSTEMWTLRLTWITETGEVEAERRVFAVSFEDGLAALKKVLRETMLRVMDEAEEK